jgi:hypothetical protein
MRLPLHVNYIGEVTVNTKNVLRFYLYGQIIGLSVSVGANSSIVSYTKFLLSQPQILYEGTVNWDAAACYRIATERKTFASKNSMFQQWQCHVEDFFYGGQITLKHTIIKSDFMCGTLKFKTDVLPPFEFSIKMNSMTSYDFIIWRGGYVKHINHYDISGVFLKQIS